MPSPQTVREQRYARTIDREVAPVWHDRFAHLLWRHLPERSPAVTLDVHCGPGRTTAELLDRLEPEAKIVGLEPSSAMRGLAKARVAPWKERVYLKEGDLTAVADMADATYDMVTANLVLGEAHDMAGALRGLLRVTKPGGSVLATMPMYGTWAEAEDLLREVLREGGHQRPVQRLRRLANLRPTGHEVSRVLAELGVPSHHYILERERYDLLFQGGREFLFSPLVEFGPLRLWKAIITEAANPQEIFWRLKESIDTYFSGRVFCVGVVAGLLHIQIPASARAARRPAAIYTRHWEHFPTLHALWSNREKRDAAAAGHAPPEVEAAVEDVDIEIDLEESAPSGVPTQRVSAVAGENKDDSLLALLDKPRTTGDADAELDALLDQVLEFAGPTEQVQELDDVELEELDDEPEPQGDSVSRIRALIPPPPGSRRMPPPPPVKKRNGNDESDAD